jgi:predicted short-subunit dehydrogenase-like oxidoreductase (DUF2520 family)
MAVRLAIVGPGRVGTAFGLAAVAAGADLLGFVGRSEAAVQRALHSIGRGRPLQLPDLAAAHVVVFAVGDGDLGAAIAAALAAGAARPCALWLHTSGRFGLEVLEAAAAAGLRIGGLHPVVPFADGAAGRAAMRGAPGVLLPGPDSEALLRVVAGYCGLVPVVMRGGDRTLYHAACALAANGLTALRSVVDAVFAAAGGLDPVDSSRLATSLQQSALEACAALGPAAALSGPVRRGDAATVAAHLAALAGRAPDALPVYRALMSAAAALAEQAGLPPDRLAAIRAQLAEPDAGGFLPPSGD